MQHDFFLCLVCCILYCCNFITKMQYNKKANFFDNLQHMLCWNWMHFVQCNDFFADHLLHPVV